MSTGNVKLCYIVIDSFIVSMKSEDTYADLTDAEIRFDRINYKVERSWTNKGWTGWENNEWVCHVEMKDVWLSDRWSLCWLKDKGFKEVPNKVQI